MQTRARRSGLEPLLEAELRDVARRLRARRLYEQRTRHWLIVGGVSVLWIAIELLFRPPPLLAVPLVGGVIAAAMFSSWREARGRPLDFTGAARAIEQVYPELRQAIRTAVEQRPEQGHEFGFLQKRVISEALAHARANDWNRLRPPPRFRLVATRVVTACAAVWAGVLTAAGRFPVGPSFIRGQGALTVEVTPGNAEVERGSAVIIAARFGPRRPRQAVLVWRNADGRTQNAAMARSLSDPVYAFTLPALRKDTRYYVDYEGKSTEEFRLTVFDLPALAQANAALDYPDYTGLTDRRIEDTRRVSAVEGTRVEYEFLVNKPLRRAALREADGQETELTAANPERTRFVTTFTLEKSRRYALRLEDDLGRVNPRPDDIRLEALPNRRPELKLTFPQGDRRVSALEEVRLQAEGRDDFKLLDYGLASARAPVRSNMCRCAATIRPRRRQRSSVSCRSNRADSSPTSSSRGSRGRMITAPTGACDARRATCSSPKSGRSRRFTARTPRAAGRRANGRVAPASRARN